MVRTPRNSRKNNDWGVTVMDDEMNEMPVGEPGTLWFKPASEFNYHKEPEKTAEAYSADKA